MMDWPVIDRVTDNLLVCFQDKSDDEVHIDTCEDCEKNLDRGVAV